MLFVAGELLPDDGGGGTDGSGAHLLALLETHLELAAQNENFLRCLPANGNAREKRDGRQHKCVVVKQGEVACINIIKEAASNVCVGSEDATTCVIAVAECAETGLLAAAHFDDGTATEGCAAQLVAGMTSPVLYLCGAYADPKGTGATVAAKLLAFLHRCAIRMEVRLACIGARNTAPDGAPLARDLLFEQRTGQAAPVRVAVDSSDAVYGAPLPAFTLREARMWLTNADRLHEVYSREDGAIVVPRFSYDLDSRHADFFAYCLIIGEDEMLSFTSTSPQHERPDFVETQRSTFKWILAHPTDNDCFAADDEVRFIWEAERGRWVRETSQPSVMELVSAKARGAIN